MSPPRCCSSFNHRSIMVFLCILALKWRVVYAQKLELTVGELDGDVYIAWSGSLDIDSLGVPFLEGSTSEASTGDDLGINGGYRFLAFPTDPSFVSNYVPNDANPTGITGTFSGPPGDWDVDDFNASNVTGTGDPVGLGIFDGVATNTGINLPQNYNTGESIEGCIIHSGQSFASLGVNIDTTATASWVSNGVTQEMIFRTQQDAFTAVPEPCLSIAPTQNLELTVGELGGDVYIAWSGSLDVDSLGTGIPVNSINEESIGSGGVDDDGYELFAYSTDSMIARYESSDINYTFSGPPGNWRVIQFFQNNVTGTGDPVSIAADSFISLPRPYTSGEQIEGCIIHSGQSFGSLDVNDDTTATASWISNAGFRQEMNFRTQQRAFTAVPEPCLPLIEVIPTTPLELTVGEFDGDVYISWSGRLDIRMFGDSDADTVEERSESGEGSVFLFVTRDWFAFPGSGVSQYGAPVTLVASNFPQLPGNWSVTNFDTSNVDSTGDPVGLSSLASSSTQPFIFLPTLYQSGELIEGCIIHRSQSFATLGVDNGVTASVEWLGLDDGTTAQQVIFRTQRDAFVDSGIPSPCFPLARTQNLELTVGELGGKVYIAWSGSLDIDLLGTPSSTGAIGEESAGDDAGGRGYRLLTYPSDPSQIENYRPPIPGDFSGAPGDWSVRDFDVSNVTGTGDPVGLTMTNDGMRPTVALPQNYSSGEPIEGCIIHAGKSFETLGVTDGTTASASWLGSDLITVQQMEFRTQRDAFVDSGVPRPCFPLASTQKLELMVGELDGDVYISWSGSLDVDSLGTPDMVSFGERSVGDSAFGGLNAYRLFAYTTDPSDLSTYVSSSIPAIVGAFSGPPGSWVVISDFDDNNVTATGDPVGLFVSNDFVTTVALPQNYSSGELIEGCIIHAGKSFETLGVTDDTAASASWLSSDRITVQQMEFRTQRDAFVDSGVPRPCFPLASTQKLELMVGELDGDVYISWSGSLDVDSLGTPDMVSFGERSVGDSAFGGLNAYRLFAYPTDPSDLSTYVSSSIPAIVGAFSGPPGSWVVISDFDDNNVTATGDPVGLFVSNDFVTTVALPQNYSSGELIEGCIIHAGKSFETLGVTDDTAASATWLGSDRITVQQMVFRTQQGAFTSSGIPRPCLPLSTTTTSQAGTPLTTTQASTPGSTTAAITSTSMEGVSSSTSTASTSATSSLSSSTSTTSTSGSTTPVVTSTSMKGVSSSTSTASTSATSSLSSSTSTTSTSGSTTPAVTSTSMEGVSTSTVSTSATTISTTVGVSSSTLTTSNPALTTTTTSFRGATTQAATSTSGLTTATTSFRGVTSTTQVATSTVGLATTTTTSFRGTPTSITTTAATTTNKKSGSTTKSKEKNGKTPKGQKSSKRGKTSKGPKGLKGGQGHHRRPREGNVGDYDPFFDETTCCW